MNKNKLISLIFLFLGTPALLTCSAISKKNGIIAADAELILLQRNDRKIFIQKCSSNALENAITDCKLKEAGSAIEVSEEELKDHLKTALDFLLRDYFADDQRNYGGVDKSVVEQKAYELFRQDSLTGTQHIQDFLKAAGAPIVVLQNLDELGKKLLVMDFKSAEKSEALVREIRSITNAFIDKLISQPKLFQTLSASGPMGIEYNILGAYLRVPKLSADFAKLSQGEFQMGSPESESGHYEDEVLHKVVISHDFEMASTPTTQMQWFQVMGYNPSYFKLQRYCPDEFVQINGADICPSLPVEQVSWYDTQDIIQRLNQANQAHLFRLPTESEWEYAARAGTKTAYYFGSKQISDNAWYYSNSGSHSCPVATKPANPFGLYDMSGNVFQWVQDWYGAYPKTKVIDPKGVATGSFRVARGGSWINYDEHGMRSAYRYSIYAPALKNFGFGFRLVRMPNNSLKSRTAKK